ncbi:MAG TPA: hypothetical protein VFH29_01940, partial [Anaerolineales bacterium]|nr:hypothetical protein [Anaerolineales bacterium]
MIDPKHPIPGQNAGNAPSGPDDGAHQILGSQGSPNIGEDELLVNKTAAQQGNEDIKNIMEHVKNISGDDGLDDLHMQDLIQKNQKSLDELSNISKKTSDTGDS